MRFRVFTAAFAIFALSACAPSPQTSPSAPGAPTSSSGSVTAAPLSDFTVQCPQWAAATSADGDRLPAFSLECLGSGGAPVDIGGIPPRPTIVNLWASWCAPCREEMPIIEQFWQEAGGQVDVLGIATSDTRSAATSFALDFGMTFPSVLDVGTEIVADRGLQGIPATIFINDQGVVTYVHRLAYASIDELKADVAEYLQVSI